MHGTRIFYGLAQIPTLPPAQQARLPAIVLSDAPLRLNTHRLPQAAMPTDADACFAAVRNWLHAACGDYGLRQKALIDAYLELCRERLHAAQETLNRFHDLFRVEDWLWSALRPLPRAWIPTPSGHAPVGLAFWTGSTLLHDENWTADVLETIAELDRFWESQMLPATPFGRDIPELRAQK